LNTCYAYKSAEKRYGAAKSDIHIQLLFDKRNLIYRSTIIKQM